MSSSRVVRILVLFLPLLALLPAVRIAFDWMTLSRIVQDAPLSSTPRSYDWVVWGEQDGLITARYVFPRGPAAKAGLQNDDVFYQLDYQQYFNVEDLRHAIEGIEPGSRVVYSVFRNGRYIEAQVQFTRYPTFLYPFSPTLWQFSIWGFTLGAFSHILALVIVGPLAVRSRRAKSSLLLITLSSIWMFGNLLRLIIVQVFGPPLTYGGPSDLIFQGLTFAGLTGWILFPAVLLDKAVFDTALFPTSTRWSWRLLFYVPALILCVGMANAAFFGHVGPLTRDELISPILFYVSVYIGAAALLVGSRYKQSSAKSGVEGGRWSRNGSLATFIAALFGALAVLVGIPQVGAVNDQLAAWLIVCGQLLSIAPIVLVSLATLKYGKINEVLGRGIIYLAAFGLVFFAFIAGITLLRPALERIDASLTIMAGFYVIFLLAFFEWLMRRARQYASGILITERTRARQILSRFQLHIRSILDHDSLTRQTVETISTAYGARFVHLQIRKAGPDTEWLVASHESDSPGLGNMVHELAWPHIQREGRIWARNAELNDSSMSKETSDVLRDMGVALIFPVLGESGPIGLLAIGTRKRRPAVYNLEDIELLRSLSGQLALAVERLKLIEREKALIRESAEAQLIALRAQINPHFLFNALNTIISLIEDQPHEAESTVEHLASIFRYVLKTGSRPFVTLEEETTLIADYLAIEQARFGDRLQTELFLDPDVASTPVPAFTIQTIVENAVKHGLEKRRSGGFLKITCRRVAGGNVEIVVSDNGVGIPAIFDRQEDASTDRSFYGIGLRNISARLEQLYGRSDLLEFKSAYNEGTMVRLLLTSKDLLTADEFTEESAGHLLIDKP